MDPDIVRLILIVLGVLLVAGIYLWDRYKRQAPRGSMVRTRERREPVADVGVDDEAPWDDGVDFDDEPMLSATSTDEHAQRRQQPPQSSQRGRALDPEPAEIGEWGALNDGADAQFTMDLKFDAHSDADYLHADPALAGDVERKLVVMHLVSRASTLSGPAIAKACALADLRHGEMAIYHYHDGGSGRVLFSMANMVEPGSFPIEQMDGFSTPGVTFFTQLPGARDGVEIFDRMLRVGRQLATALQAELQDDAHNKLTGQMEKHIRESIIEHRRRIQLARSRH